MFEYAALVGACVYRGAGRGSCVVISRMEDNVFLPLKKVVRGFNIPRRRKKCDYNNSSTTELLFYEHSGDMASYYYDREFFSQEPGFLHCTTIFIHQL